MNYAVGCEEHALGAFLIDDERFSVLIHIITY